MSEQLKDLQALFRDAMEWGRAYLNRAMEVTIEEVSLGLAEKAAALSPHHAAPGAPQQEASGVVRTRHAVEAQRRAAFDARWGSPSPEPSTGEVGDLINWCRSMAEDGETGEPSRAQFKKLAQVLTSRAAATAPAGGVTDERAMFEAWDKPLSDHRDHDRNGRGEYIDERTRERWESWQACVALTTAARVAELEKYDDTLLPFLALMRRELHANSAKGDRPGWLSMTPDKCLLEIYWHVSKLSVAVRDGALDRIAEHCADVANMAMMQADIAGLLAASPTPPTTAARAAEPAEQWRDMSTAPKDATMLRLLVQFDEGSFEDSDEPVATIGTNHFENTGVDEWLFAGWNWTHDCFTQGTGKPLGWLPMLAASPTSPTGTSKEGGEPA